jgi:hypothetical protein
MGARLRIFLTQEQDKTLLKLRTADVPQKVKDRALVVRLNAQGWYVEKIAAHFNWTSQTVREVLHKWQKLGMEGFWEVTAHRNCVAVSQMEPQMVMEKFARFVETGNFPSSKCRPPLKIATVTSPQLSSTEL